MYGVNLLGDAKTEHSGIHDISFSRHSIEVPLLGSINGNQYEAKRHMLAPLVLKLEINNKFLLPAQRSYMSHAVRIN